MAQIIPFGDPVNDAERLAIAHLRDHLPGRPGSNFASPIAVPGLRPLRRHPGDRGLQP